MEAQELASRQAATTKFENKIRRGTAVCESRGPTLITQNRDDRLSLPCWCHQLFPSVKNVSDYVTYL
ncbi:hypothetical protein WN51_06407 [Melipona quadrifasciata]|uniref:Uncharacterized protein n=1 Tax=Melipona quadrifasciata TaxID=166423 RepID=A0A0M9A9I6_9HYME|nr:hypothetical protein WN51_06407 [Melipona quadrifasciata]